LDRGCHRDGVDRDRNNAARDHPAQPVPCLGFLVFVMWVSGAVAVKRLHVRNKSWVWPLITMVPAVLLLWTGMAHGLQALLEFAGSPRHVTVQIALWGWYVIELDFMKGTPGRNMYGPVPDGKGVFSPEFDAFLVGEGYDVQARKHTDAATAMASSSSVLTLARVPRAGAVVRQGGLGRHNARA
jgi:uncharacterized membrane protein YhaH (DUF805 family)